MAENPVLQKLRMKSVRHAAVVGAPENLRAMLTDVPEAVDVSEQLEGKFDFILCFVRTKVEVGQMALSLKEGMKPGAILWIAYPKGKAMATDLNRDILREAMASNGLE